MCMQAVCKDTSVRGACGPARPHTGLTTIFHFLTFNLTRNSSREALGTLSANSNERNADSEKEGTLPSP